MIMHKSGRKEDKLTPTLWDVLILGGAICLLLTMIIIATFSLWNACVASTDDISQKESVLYGALEREYGADLSGTKWKRVSSLPDDRYMIRGWGYDTAGTPTLYYMDKPDEPLGQCDPEDIKLYVASGDDSATLTPCEKRETHDDIVHMDNMFGDVTPTGAEGD